MSFDWLGFEPYVDLVSPGFVHVTDSRPMAEFYQVPADPDASGSCCLRAVVVSRHEFSRVTECPIHGRKDGGNVD